MSEHCEWGDVTFTVDELGEFPKDAGRCMGERAGLTADRLKWRSRSNPSDDGWWVHGPRLDVAHALARTALASMFAVVAPWFDATAVWTGYVDRRVICRHPFLAGRRGGKSSAVADFARLLDLPLTPHQLSVLDEMRGHVVDEHDRAPVSRELVERLRATMMRDPYAQALIRERVRRPRLGTCVDCGCRMVNPTHKTCVICGVGER